MENNNLTEAEFLTVCSILNGSAIIENEWFPHLHWSKKDKNKQPCWDLELLSDFEESIQLNNLEKHFKINADVFLEKLLKHIENNTFTQILADVDSYWRRTYPLNKMQSN